MWSRMWMRAARSLKDTASGQLVTHAYTVTGPAAIFLSTTAIDVDEELR
jgi:hypothetical protein